MADNPAGVQQAVQRALSEALASLGRQLGEVQTAFEQVKAVLKSAGERESEDRYVALLAPLIHLQASGAALTATVETLLRFVGASAQWTGAPAMAPPPAARVEEAREAREAEEVAAPEEEAAVTVEEAPAAVAEEPAVEEAPAAVEAAPVDVSALPDELKTMHHKAKRFAKVTVQELIMYKKDEVAKGCEGKDLYRRFKDEIDKSKALYDKRFEKISGHNIDYLYDELVRVLADNDPEALGDYPYRPSYAR